jgi:hypothetical protein
MQLGQNHVAHVSGLHGKRNVRVAASGINRSERCRAE